MKNLLLLSFSFVLVFFMFSCGGGVGPEQNDRTKGVTKLVFINKTDYEVKEIYYKQTSKFSSKEGYGTALLNGNTLADKNKLIICPDFVNSGNSEPYYFTFKRQKGSTDNNLYITTDIPIYLSNNSGIVTIELLPYKFYYSRANNSQKTCSEEIQDGE